MNLAVAASCSAAGARVRPIVARIIPVRFGLAQRAPLGHDLAADGLRGMDLADETLIARHLLRRDHQWRGGKAAAGAGSDRKAAGALGQRTEPRAGAIADVDRPTLPSGSG